MTPTFYNTLTRHMTPLSPQQPGPNPSDPLNGATITMYSCGPTVYDYAHIGNFRSFLFADLLRRYLEIRGAQVRHVMNMTDVGHMTDDQIADGAGRDKLELAVEKMKETKKTGVALVENANDPFQVADYFIQAFLRDAVSLRLAVAMDHDRAADHEKESIMPRPTRHIADFVTLIQQLISRGHAYVGTDGVVYFDVGSFPEYGKLSGNSVEQLSHGAGGRTNEQAAKRHPADFFLWKPDVTHIMRWPSPWGKGYPGWHVECSSMAMGILGPTLDIHTGGEDNIFPHHECEIAQSQGATDRPFVRLWMHARHLMVNGEKMSKSKANFFTIRDLTARGYDPLVVRYALMAARYRETQNFTIQSLHEAAAAITTLRDLADKLTLLVVAVDESAGNEHINILDNLSPPPSETDPEDAFMLTEFDRGLAEDLNISAALAAVFTWAAALLKQKTIGFPRARSALRALQRVDHVLQVVFTPTRPLPPETLQAIENLIARRKAAKISRDFAQSDALRKELTLLGVEVMDTAKGMAWRRRLAPVVA